MRTNLSCWRKCWIFSCWDSDSLCLWCFPRSASCLLKSEYTLCLKCPPGCPDSLHFKLFEDVGLRQAPDNKVKTLYWSQACPWFFRDRQGCPRHKPHKHIHQAPSQESWLHAQQDTAGCVDRWVKDNLLPESCYIGKVKSCFKAVFGLLYSRPQSPWAPSFTHLHHHLTQ